MTDTPQPPPKPRKHRIFLVDDHPITRAGLAHLIHYEPDLEVCGQAGSAARALTDVATLAPDLVMVDISLAGGADGLELIKDLAARHPRLRMLALSTCEESLYAERALRAGARGYLMKQEPTEAILAAIRNVLAGEIHLSKAMEDKILRRAVKPASAPLAPDVAQLSDRELEVYCLLGRGHGTRQIAAELHLSVSTVENHRAHIKNKLHVSTAPELIQHAVEWFHNQPA
jgi:DNA-binding NarL/FixJ family response regulator